MTPAEQYWKSNYESMTKVVESSERAMNEFKKLSELQAQLIKKQEQLIANLEAQLRRKTRCGFFGGFFGGGQ